MNDFPLNIEALKLDAKAIRRQTGMSYGHALDLVAKKSGYADWNAASARAPAPSSDPSRAPKKLRNHVVLGIVLDYRFRDCMEPPDAITERFRRDYPDRIYDADFFQKIISMNPFRLARESDYPNKWNVTIPDAFERAAKRFDPDFSWIDEIWTPQQEFRIHLNARRKSGDFVNLLTDLFEGLDISNTGWTDESRTTKAGE